MHLTVVFDKRTTRSRTLMTVAIPEYIDGLPAIAGHEADLERPSRCRFDGGISAGEQDRLRPHQGSAMIALHMHQPLIPAGGSDLRTAAIISNLKHMMDHQGIGDNHNAPVLFMLLRMGEFIPQLMDEGKEPR